MGATEGVAGQWLEVPACPRAENPPAGLAWDGGFHTVVFRVKQAKGRVLALSSFSSDVGNSVCPSELPSPGCEATVS